MMATTAVTVSKRRTVNLSGMAQRQSDPAAMSTKPSMSSVKMNLGPFMPLNIAVGEVAGELRYTSAMLTSLRYTLASVCFAASVSCLAWWGWNLARSYTLDMAHLSFASATFTAEACGGIVAVWSDTAKPNDRFWRAGSHRLADTTQFLGIMRQQGLFGTIGPAIYFPLWYPALVFTLAGVGVLCFRRQFSIRSALIAFAVVAALLAMPVVL